MKLERIEKIKSYKAFVNFEWNKFFNAENFHEKVNIIYGENGSGKTSICNILKDLVGSKKFMSAHLPEEAILSFNDGKCTYKKTTKNWDNKKNSNDLIFFDKEFVNKNIHSNHLRETTYGGQEQESGKLIIQFDSRAINLREKRNSAKEDKDIAEKEAKDYFNENKDDLNFRFTQTEKKIYGKLKSKSKKEIAELKKRTEVEKKNLESKIEIDHIALSKVVTIQKNVNPIDQDIPIFTLSNYGDYQSLFDFDLEKRTKVKATEDLIMKIRNYKDFFESGLEIRKKYRSRCPFCQSQKEEKNIKKIIKVYNQLYGDNYKKQLNDFNKKKKNLIEELNLIVSQIAFFDTNSIFLSLKKLDEEYNIKGIYSVKEETKFQKPQTKQILKFINVLNNLKKPNKNNIRKQYQIIQREVATLQNYVKAMNTFINRKNAIISNFKNNNTSNKIRKRININEEKIDYINDMLFFIAYDKLESKKKKDKKTKKWNSLKKIATKAKKKYKDIRLKYENYVSEEAFTKLLNKIEDYFNQFNFNFKLKLDTERKSRSTKEFPFAFKVLDSEDRERDLKEGLSEGEIQVLSLCFFFAFLDIQSLQNRKIIVFDDPITSLDNSNLGCLVDIIADKVEKFSQIFVLTHHRTFFKFLRKRFNTSKRSFAGNEYNLIRNIQMLGGSFICKSKQKKFITKLKTFENSLQNIPPESIDLELEIAEYGQYLRYEIERFIKNKLLYWNSKDFRTAVEGIKSNKRIQNKDLDQIIKVYSFCNWTTSHVNVGDENGLEQLKTKINDFITIYDKYKSVT